MKFLIEGVQFFIPSILTEDKIVKGWKGLSDSFDQILDHPFFLSFCHDEVAITWVYEIIDHLYKVELDMNKFILEGKEVTDAKWTNCIDELKGIRDATWPDIDIDIEILEVEVDIKALPSGDSD